MGFFPHRLTPFEFYMLADDRPSHPMVFRVRLRFAGRLDLARLRTAASAIRLAHPLLAARLCGAKAWTAAGAAWIDAGPHDPPLTRAPDGLGRPPRIDLTTAVGWRGYLTPASDGDTLTVLFHHACCDGIGALKFLEDLLTCYDDPAAVPPPPNCDTLRDTPGDGWADHLRRLPHDLQRIANYFRTAPRPLASARPSSSCYPAEAAERLASVFLQAGETAALRRAARAASVSLNDLLLRDLYLTLFSWNAARGERRDGTVRVAVPMNLRRGPANASPNCCSMVFLDRRPGAVPEELLASLAAEMDGVRRLRTGQALLQVLRVAAVLPGGVRAIVGGGCAATAVFSNLGRAFEKSPLTGPSGRVRVGDAELESVEAMPPVRPLTHAAFAAVTYGGRLALSLDAHPDALGSDEAEELLAEFAGRLRTRLAKAVAVEEAVL